MPDDWSWDGARGMEPGWIEPVIRCMVFLGSSLEGLGGRVGPEAKQRQDSSWNMKQQEQEAEFAEGVSEQWVWLNQTWLPSSVASSPNKASRLPLEKQICPSSGEHLAVLSLLLSNVWLDLKQLWKCHCWPVLFVLIFGGVCPTQKSRRDVSRSLWV